MYRALCPTTLDARDIINNKSPMTYQPIIYFLLSGNEIVYIGKSMCGFARIYKHVTDKTKSFTHYYYHSVPEEYITLLEKQYIKKFLPKYNIVHNIKKNPESRYTIDENGKRVFRVKHRKNFVPFSARTARRCAVM
jgi:excinuclease UvrABC nuclease subunit